jgi:hypothetical protein
VPIWQFSTLPAVPEHCRWTPAERVPFLDEPGVVSDQHAVGVAEAFDQVAAKVVPDQMRIPARAVEHLLHRVRRPPACSAIVHPLRRSHGASSPRTYANASRRGSTRENRPAITEQIIQTRLRLREHLATQHDRSTSHRSSGLDIGLQY